MLAAKRVGRLLEERLEDVGRTGLMLEGFSGAIPSTWPWRIWHLGQAPCAINQIIATEDGFTVRSLNEIWHLGGA